MNFRVLLEFWRFAASFVFCMLVLSCANVAAATDTNPIGLNGFVVSGVALGMQFEQVLKIYPTSVVENRVTKCYSKGRPISLPELTRRIVRYKDDEGELTMSFEPPFVGGRLSRIDYDRALISSKFDTRNLLDELVAQYGSPDRILHRRKMEPAGRIVGFEWHNTNAATLRVVLRNNHHNASDNLQLTFLAIAPSRKLQLNRRTSCP